MGSDASCDSTGSGISTRGGAAAWGGASDPARGRVRCCAVCTQPRADPSCSSTDKYFRKCFGWLLGIECAGKPAGLAVLFTRDEE